MSHDNLLEAMEAINNVRSLHQWLCHKDDDMKYDYADPCNCLLQRYFSDMARGVAGDTPVIVCAGYTRVSVFVPGWSDHAFIELSEHMDEVAASRNTPHNEHTFTIGEARSRAKAIIDVTTPVARRETVDA